MADAELARMRAARKAAAEEAASISSVLPAHVTVPDDDTVTSPSIRRLKHTFASVAAATHILRKSRYTMPFGDLSMTVLMHACATGNSERVRQCLESLRGEAQREALEIELKAADDWAGSTPLHWAAFAGNAHVVEMLLDVGADVAAHNQRDGSLPIHLAARYGKTAALVALADDANGRKCVNAINHLGNTPLHECAYEGRAEGADMLLNRGATAALEIANSMEKGGLTPLLAAIEYGHVGVVQVMLLACQHSSAARRPIAAHLLTLATASCMCTCT